jgi:hypothetical protein
MHPQRTALRRWLIWHRRQLAAGTALGLLAAVLTVTGPLLLTLAAVEWKHSRRKRPRLLGLALAGPLAQAIVWLWQDLLDLPHGEWHPCAQCGAPIEAPSQAWYCSPACRRYARLERDARAFDPWLAERAQARLRALTQAGTDPELAEISF